MGEVITDAFAERSRTRPAIAETDGIHAIGSAASPSAGSPITISWARGMGLVMIAEGSRTIAFGSDVGFTRASTFASDKESSARLRSASP